MREQSIVYSRAQLSVTRIKWRKWERGREGGG